MENRVGRFGGGGGGEGGHCECPGIGGHMKTGV